MSGFVASNGVELDERGYCPELSETAARVHEARKEFYQHLRDKELGRWRDPEAPNFVVYEYTQDNTTRIRVVDENAGWAELYFRYRTDSTDYGDTAARYFAAHPEPKPWRFPEKGEVWVITHNEVTSAYLYGEGSLFRNDHMPALLPTDANITDGYRIWPGNEV